MAESLSIPVDVPQSEKWSLLLPQLEALVESEPNCTANLANVSAALYAAFGWHWVGFYVVDVKRDELVLGPFQGPIACTRLHHGRGVCAAAWDSGATVQVPDVEAFPGHIACSSATRSEVVVPIFSTQQVVAVLDVDSVDLNGFDETDVRGLETIARFISESWAVWEH